MKSLLIVFCFFLFATSLYTQETIPTRNLPPFSEWKLNENVYICSDNKTTCGYLEKDRWNAHSCIKNNEFLWIQGYAALQEIPFSAKVRFSSFRYFFITTNYDAYFQFKIFENKTESLGDVEIFIDINDKVTNLDLRNECYQQYCTIDIPFKFRELFGNHLKIYGKGRGGIYPIQTYLCDPKIVFLLKN